MSRTFKILLGAGIGGAIGYAVGSIVVDQLYPEYYTEEELAEAYSKATAAYSVEHVARTEKLVAEELAKRESEPKTGRIAYESFYKVETDEEKPTTPVELLRKIHNEGLDRNPSIDEEREEAELLAMQQTELPEDLSELTTEEYFEMVDVEVPHVITVDQYIENEDQFSQSLLKYYPDDGVLTDEADRPIHNAEKVVGFHALQNFGFESEDEEMVYVKNPKLGALYRMINMRGEYEEMVLGALPREEKNAPKTVKRNIFDDQEGEEDANWPLDN